MSRIHRFTRSLAVASVALMLVAGASFAHDAVFDAPASPVSPPSARDIHEDEPGDVDQQEPDTDAAELRADQDDSDAAVAGETEVEDADDAADENEADDADEDEADDADADAADDADADEDEADDADADAADDADDPDDD